MAGCDCAYATSSHKSSYMTSLVYHMGCNFSSMDKECILQKELSLDTCKSGWRERPIILPSESELVSRKYRRFPNQMLRIYPPSALALRSLVPLQNSIGQTYYVLAFIVLKQLQCSAPKQ